MGQGRDLGLQLRRWLEAEPEAMRSGRTIHNRLLDALGAQDGLKGPIRDLSAQPLLLQVLHTDGARQRSALASLSQQLRTTYSPAVLQELLDLLMAATGLEPAAAAEPTSVEEAVQPQQTRPETQQDIPAAKPQEQRQARQQTIQNQPPKPWDWQASELRQRCQALKPTLLAMAPGLALAASGALVFAWLARELDTAVFEGWGWSGGVVLVLVLGAIQAVSMGPLRDLRRLWPLDAEQAVQPQQAWRWLGTAWIHRRDLEAALNLMVLLVLLGDAALQLGDVVLRYCLTALATLAPAVILASHWQIACRWSGSAGPISALIALSSGLSLLHREAHTFTTPLFSVPAWVLMLVFGALQLHWQLTPNSTVRTGTPVQRLFCCQWTWGLLLGLSWAVASWIQEVVKAAGAPS